MMTRRFLLVTGFAISAFASIVLGQSEPPALTDAQKAAILKEAGAPAGSEVGWEKVVKTSKGGKTTTTKKGESTGPSMVVVGDKVVANIDGKPVEMSLADLGLVKGGGFGASSSAEVTGAVWYRIVLGLIGLGLIAGGIYKAVQKEYDTAITQIGSGALCGVCAIFPALLYLMAIGMVLSSLAHYLPDKVKSAYHAFTDGLGEAFKAAATNQTLDNALKTVLPFVKQQATPADIQHIQTTAASNGNPVSLT